MSTKRSSILFYFDNFHTVADLPDEQLGILFRAVMESGELEVNGRDGTAGYRERYPRMSDRIQMAYLFMMGNVRRDAAAYEAKCAGHRGYTQRRREPQKEENSREMSDYVRQLAASVQRKP